MKLQCRHTSFSLVEVTIALGVAAICLIGIFGLLPIGLQTDQNATEQSRALGISSVVIADLRATPGSGSGTSPQLGIPIPVLSAASVSAAPLYPVDARGLLPGRGAIINIFDRPVTLSSKHYVSCE